VSAKKPTIEVITGMSVVAKVETEGGNEEARTAIL
jgi:hypothetical protein